MQLISAARAISSVNVYQCHCQFPTHIIFVCGMYCYLECAIGYSVICLLFCYIVDWLPATQSKCIGCWMVWDNVCLFFFKKKRWICGKLVWMWVVNGWLGWIYWCSICPLVPVCSISNISHWLIHYLFGLFCLFLVVLLHNHRTIYKLSSYLPSITSICLNGSNYVQWALLEYHTNNMMCVRIY